MLPVHGSSLQLNHPGFKHVNTEFHVQYVLKVGTIDTASFAATTYVRQDCNENES